MAQQPGHPLALIRPQQMATLPHFSEEQKEHYRKGLAGLWQTFESSPQGSQQHTEAHEKIKQASVKIYQQIQRASRPGSGGGPQQAARPPGQQGGNAQGGVAMAQQGSAQGGLPGGQNQVVPQSQGQQQLGLSAPSRQEISNVPIQIPPAVMQQGETQVNAYRTQWFSRAVQLLTKRDQAKARGARLQQMQRSGQVGNSAPQVEQEMQRCHNEMKQAHGEWEKMRNANNALLQQAGGQGMQRQHSSGGNVNGQQQAQQQGAEVNMSPQQPQSAFQQSQAQPHTSQPPVAPSPVQAQQPQQNMGQQTSAAQNYSQQMNMAQQQASQQQGQPQRPQMNAQQMAQAQAQQNMQQQQQQQQHTQNSAVPQSATQQQVPQQNQQQQQQRPQPLTHQAAVNQAAQSYSREQQAAQQQGSQQNVPQLPNGQMSLNGVPQSATQTTPSSAYPAMQQQAHGGPSTTKFPIPKQLTLDPRTQAPVPGPPSRPTYQSSGMMQQPGVQRPAQFTLEGEGDRVLSKRKLDELVRQVTGTPATDPSSDSHALAPDVEEAVLTLADDFVDNVITAACRLAKLRSSQTLDIRDVQMALERNYGIRIPGYSLDEVRTVRKFQPAPGWTSKMQAVHSAKVMGNGGRDS